MPKGNSRTDYNLSAIIGEQQTAALRAYSARLRRKNVVR
jgi:hypothetical protein